jgi:alginate O-acetyltransferase complex protein AlgF
MSISRSWSIHVLALGVATWPLAVAAQDAGLYAAAADPNSAFIRLVDFTGGGGSINGSPVLVGEEGVSAYFNVPSGQVPVTFGTASQNEDVLPGGYYTLVLTPSGFTKFSDETLQDPSKSEVYFYNLTEERAVDLYVPAAKANAISGVAQGEGKSVALRAPLSLEFEARIADQVIATTPTLELQRKDGLSLFLTTTASGTQIVSVHNTISSAQ